MTEEISEQRRGESFQDDLFKCTMKKDWKEVVKIYRENSSAHETKLTKSEETALHIAISSYLSKTPGHAIYIEQMIEVMEKHGSLIDVLRMQNVRGDTPLHLAAAIGCDAICKRMASKDRELIKSRNENGETPLFIAAHHGKLEAFLCLHELYHEKKDDQQAEPETDDSLCRRKDGNTILHSAISGEFFMLAYQIINYYPVLVNAVNVDGETPLHVLARKPNVFKSSDHLRFYDSIIYHCVFVDELKRQKYNPSASQNGSGIGSEIRCPGNYRTCVDIFFLLGTPIYNGFLAGFPSFKKRNVHPPDEEKQHDRQKEHGIENANGKSIEDAVVPPNYTTCILLYKFAMKVILIVLGVGFWRIRKIQEKKVRNHHALQIMNKMIEYGYESSYKYDNSGQRPDQKPESLHLEAIDIPDAPPLAGEHDVHQSTQTNIATTPSTKAEQENENEKDQNKSASKPILMKTWSKNIELDGLLQHLARTLRSFDAGERTSKGLVKKKETPLLVAAKMGIPEMVKKIISTCPVAIQDLDSNGKNVLMLAAENRQTSVFDYLLDADLPEYMFNQVDNEGNSILHLAAKLGELQPWRIPGAALQMQWEIKWYKHVKRSVPPLSFAHYNTEGETPRKIFTRTHKDLMKSGNEWLIKTSESCSVVAALIATVAFATSATVPGGLDEQKGYPILIDHKAFDVFSIVSLVALCLAVTALVFFLAIITSRCEERDFKSNLPKKLLMGLSSLFASIAAMLLSFCAGHTFILREKLRVAAVPIYAVAIIPVTFFAVAQLPLYFDLLHAACKKVPLRSYKVFHQ